MRLEEINKDDLYNVSHKCLLKIVIKNDIYYGYVIGKGKPLGYYFRIVNPDIEKKEIESSKFIFTKLIDNVYSVH
jgi:hypothetical protein